MFFVGSFGEKVLGVLDDFPLADGSGDKHMIYYGTIIKALSVC